METKENVYSTGILTTSNQILWLTICFVIDLLILIIHFWSLFLMSL